ncbi:MAG: hypothetical protein KBE65_21550 [Phycisphaerae bacterium]|nr:hypothetical protein [Phycisphaerae bacterium]
MREKQAIGRIDRRFRGLLPIYADAAGEYCRIPLTRRMYAKVDPEDFCWLSQYRWHYVRTSRTFYAVRPSYHAGRSGKVWMHREIMGTPRGLVCDHINHNGLDNRKANLRNCTVAQNNLNRVRYRNGRSRYKGVWWSRSVQMWGAQIQACGRAEFLGYFVHEVQAARAYDAAARRLHGEFASLNFPEEQGDETQASRNRQPTPTRTTPSAGETRATGDERQDATADDG